MTEHYGPVPFRSNPGLLDIVQTVRTSMMERIFITKLF